MSVQDKELSSYIEKLPSASFKNQYGEKFTIHSNGIRTLLSGDEINGMVNDNHKIEDKYIDLFNEHFNILSVEEIRKIGIALQEVADKVENERS